MKTACATFSAIPRGVEGEADLLMVCTAIPSASDAQTHNVEQFLDPPCPLETAFGGTGNMEESMKLALAAGSGYPVEMGEAMLQVLGWMTGLERLLSAKPSLMKLTLSYETCSLLPELVPVPTPDGGVTWLDTIVPIHRTLHHIEQHPARRCSEKSLAIIHQDEAIFFDLANHLQEALQDKLIVDVYKGTEFEVGGVQRFALLHEVFHKHRAVLFIGHLHRGKEGSRGGWQLTRETVLTMAELMAFLGGGRTRSGGRFVGHGVGSGGPIPEVVVANCCFSAGSEPALRMLPGLSYPNLFLDAGVRFFIGTSMDMVFSARNLTHDLEIMRRMLGEFFLSWAERPDEAVTHLYNAKKKCGFHLLTSLYQIYTSGSEPIIEAGARAPLSALVSGILPDDQIGDYRIVSEVWTDPYARTFWAKHATHESPHLVQVFIDEWQDSPGLAEELQAAMGKLKEAALSPGHLLPTRYDAAMLSRQGKPLRRLHLLVYDRPLGEKVEDWSTLASRPFDRASSHHFMAVLQLGAEVSARLAELHAKGILHGNLSPNSIVFRKSDGVELLMLKDAWVRQTRPGRCTNTRYAAPEEAAPEENKSDELKSDCWGLGVILFELAAGQPPFGESESPGQGLRHSIKEVIGREAVVPEALDRIVRECLVPSAKVRPSAELVTKRLLLASLAGGTYISEVEDELNLRIQAGQRLFAVLVDDIAELEEALNSLASRRNPYLLTRFSPASQTFGYHLYVVTEEVGLVDQRSGNVVVPWVSAQEVFQMMTAYAMQYNLSQPGFPTSDGVAAFNSELIFGYISNLRGAFQDLPVVFIRGNEWWDYGPPVWRILKTFQAEPQRSPVVLIADNFIRLSPELARSFVVLHFPPVAPAVLFERILDFPRTEGFPEVSAETAIQLAHQFFTCSMREVQRSLRMCALTYGVIDERALDIWDETREQMFRAIGTVTYTPVSKLKQSDFIGLPQQVEKRVQEWVNHIIEFEPQDIEFSAPRRLMITGPSGCGKTILAHALAARTRRPLVRIDAARCLRGELGESERTLQAALAVANSLHHCLVLLDDVDYFFQVPSSGESADALTPTLTRMASILLNWMDSIPPGVIAVMTSSQPERLSAQWRRRIEFTLPLELPQEESHRRAIFAAVFRKFGLDSLASNDELMEQLARQTHPVEGIPRLLSPFARKALATPLRHHTVQLRTPADIENWVKENLLLHAKEYPDTREFWLDALVGITQEEKYHG